MTEVYKFSQTEILLFSLVLLRMAGFVVSWPVFGVENASGPIKVLFAVILSLAIFPTLHWTPEQNLAVQSNLILLVLRETFIGLSIGYLARLFFFTFRVAGELISQAMGLGAAAMFNPALGGQSSAVEQFYLAVVTLFYLTMNGHHYLLTGLVESFHFLPCALVSLKVHQFTNLVQFSGEVLELGVQISAPVVIALLTVNLILGVVGKTVPQLNVLVTSFPVNIMVGLILMIVTLPLLSDQMADYLNDSTLKVIDFVKTF